MSAVNKLLDKYRAACSAASDSALAGRLGVSRQSVHQWRNGITWPTEDHIVSMAEAAGEQPGHWLPLIAAERSTSPRARSVWLGLMKAASGFVLAVGLGQAHAGALPTTRGTTDLARNPVHTIYYVNLLRSLTKLALAWIARTRKEIHACVSAGASMLLTSSCTPLPV